MDIIYEQIIFKLCKIMKLIHKWLYWTNFLRFGNWMKICRNILWFYGGLTVNRFIGIFLCKLYLFTFIFCVNCSYLYLKSKLLWENWACVGKLNRLGILFWIMDRNNDVNMERYKRVLFEYSKMEWICTIQENFSISHNG